MDRISNGAQRLPLHTRSDNVTDVISMGYDIDSQAHTVRERPQGQRRPLRKSANSTPAMNQSFFNNSQSRISIRALAMLAFVFCAQVLPSASAKFILLPKKSSPHTSEHVNLDLISRIKSNHDHDHNHKSPTGNKVVLKPKPRPLRRTAQLQSSSSTDSSSQTILLTASIIKNEEGSPVLQLTPESADLVQSALMSQADTVADEPPQQLSSENTDVDAETQVLFYDPEDIPITTQAGDLHLPNHVYDQDGNEVDMSGKEVTFVPPPPKPTPNKDKTQDTNTNSNTSTSSSSTGSSNTNNKRNSSIQKVKNIRLLNTPPHQDQLIIVATVATMALLVGALSARRLRARQFLNICIENESLEDEMAYDAAFTTQSKFSSMSRGYDTFGSAERYGGDLRWRGDLEKFDV